MFNKIWDQSRLPEKKETPFTFQTEKELILYAIEKYDKDAEKDIQTATFPKRYHDNWHERSEYGIKYIKKPYAFYDPCLCDKEVFKHLQRNVQTKILFVLYLKAIFWKTVTLMECIL